MMRREKSDQGRMCVYFAAMALALAFIVIVASGVGVDQP